MDNSSFFLVPQELAVPLRELESILREDNLEKFKTHIVSNPDFYLSDSTHWRVFLNFNLAPNCATYLLNDTKNIFLKFTQESQISILGTLLSNNRLSAFEELIILIPSKVLNQLEVQQSFIYYSIQNSEVFSFKTLLEKYKFSLTDYLNDEMAQKMYSNQNTNITQYYLNYLLQNKEHQKIITFYDIICNNVKSKPSQSREINEIVKLASYYFLQTQLQSSSRQSSPVKI